MLGLGAGLYLAADAAAGVLDGGLTWVRRIAFGLAALMLLRSALQRLRRTHGAQITLPAWFTPWTALLLGAVVTAADLVRAENTVTATDQHLRGQPTPRQRPAAPPA